MTTIITKNGSGAPTAGQLSQGELAVDLTNKELYTKDSGGNVIKVGAQGGSTGTFTDLTATSSFTSPGIDDNANATAITIDANENVGINSTNPSANLQVASPTGGNAYLSVTRMNSDSSSVRLAAENGLTSLYSIGDEPLSLGTNNSEAMRIDDAGNVGIGTASLSTPLTVSRGAAENGLVARLYAYEASITDRGLEISTDVSGGRVNSEITYNAESGAASGQHVWQTDGTERMRIDADGNVGIGTNPTQPLHVSASMASAGSGPVIQVSETSGGARNGIRYTSTAITNSAVDLLKVEDASGSLFNVKGGGNVNIENDLSLNGIAYFADKVGIGGGGVTAKLDITSTQASWLDAGDAQLALRNTNPNRAAYISFDQDANLTFYNSGSTGGSDATVFRQKSGEAMRIDSDGRVGIKYVSNYNDARLTVAGSSSTGTANSHIALVSDTSVGIGNGPQILFSDSGPGSDFAGGTIGFERTGSNSMGDLVFGTRRTAGTSTTPTTEAMRLDSAGNLLVGTTSSVGSGSAGVTVANVSGVIGQVGIAKTYSGTTGAMKFYYGSTEVGRIDYSDTSTTYVTSSDERLKENIVDAPAGNIDSIKVRSFDWKADGSHQEYGFIAQELETVAPYAVAVGETDEDMWGVDYSKLVPMMIKEIQDLKAEVAALKGA